MTQYKEFGDRLSQLRREKAARERHDILQKDVAKAVRVSPATYGRYESGEIMPKDDVMLRLAQFYDVGMGWLRYGDGGAEAPKLPLREPQRPILPLTKKGRSGR